MLYVYICIYTHAYMRTGIGVCVYAHICALYVYRHIICVFVYMQYTYVDTYVHMSVHIDTLSHMQVCLWLRTSLLQ